MKILVVDDDPDFLELTSSVLTRGGYEVIEASTGKDALEAVAKYHPDLVMLDVFLPDMSGFEVCKQIKADPVLHSTFVAFLSGVGTSSEAQTTGLDIGADGYIVKGIPKNELLARVKSLLRIKQAEDALQRAHDELEQRVKERTAELAVANEALAQRLEEIEALKQQLESENIYLQKEVKLLGEHNIVGQSAAMKTVLAQAEQVAKTDSTVLILGETGTGKELLARAIHSMSVRKNRPLVTVNCASLAPTLMESELFGREKGAYTGAMTRMAGRFEVADGSTLFLDEIGELPLELQAKLLRVLEQGVFERLGSTRPIHVDVRLIAATNRDFAEEVKEGKFRKDLYYRLNVFPIRIPPLRERSEDIPPMVWAFVSQFSEKMGKRIDTIPKKSMDALQSYPWPGNVRELRNVIERAMILSHAETLEVALPRITGAESSPEQNLEDVERRHILSVLEKTNWRVTGKDSAAEIMGLKRSTLQSMMKKLGIKRPT
ncbi:MAG TPA: sigma-54 dependent transcriptional regulator [Syntrophorhabdales bacterium]|nr:sigma-54 dependent transcriptional regulator [Syntrophorhabdales bacterium]